MSPAKTWFKIWFFIVVSSLSFIVVGYQIGGRLGLVLSLCLAFIFNGLLFIFGEGHLLHYLPLTPLKGQDPWGIGYILTNLCEKIQMNVPNVFLSDLNLPTCYCIGYTSQNATICISKSLVDKLTGPELEAILASQLVYLKTMMNKTSFGVVSILANSLVGIAHSLDRLIGLPFRKTPPIFLTLASPIGWLLIKAAVRPKVFLDNDLLAAQILSNRRQLGEVIWRLHGLTLSNPFVPPPCTNHLFILDPIGDTKKNRILRYHPTVEERMRNILGYFPI